METGSGPCKHAQAALSGDDFPSYQLMLVLPVKWSADVNVRMWVLIQDELAGSIENSLVHFLGLLSSFQHNVGNSESILSF